MSISTNLPQIALEFFLQWRRCSTEMMKVLCPTCPTFPKGPTNHGKYKKWADGEGPIGLIYHYTAGPNGIASLRWGNENPANGNSSWHATVLDHRIEEVEDIRQRYPLVVKYLPVTALLHADITQGTWHGNWVNGRCFGIENRNVGYVVLRGDRYGRVFKKRSGGHGFRPIADQKRAVLLEGRWWESYTIEQIIANINIGKMLLAWRGDKFDKRWVLPHQFIWASKSDTGPAWPMYWIREAVFDSTPVEKIDWLQSYPASMTVPFVERPADDEEREDADRGDGSPEVQEISPYEPMDAVDFDKIDGVGWRDYLSAVRENLGILGGCCDPPPPDVDEHDLDDDLRLATEIFQHSTYAKWRGPRQLKIDGVPGAKTREAIEKRLVQFGHDV